MPPKKNKLPVAVVLASVAISVVSAMIMLLTCIVLTVVAMQMVDPTAFNAEAQKAALANANSNENSNSKKYGKYDGRFEETASPARNPLASIDYSKAQSGGLSASDVDKIDLILLSTSGYPYTTTTAFDLGAKKAYDIQQINPEVWNPSECSAYKLTDNDVSSIRGDIKNADIPSWKAEYVGNTNVTDYSGWTMIVRTDDGKLYRYTGKGVGDDASPKQFNDLWMK